MIPACFPRAPLTALVARRSSQAAFPRRPREPLAIALESLCPHSSP
ncbi:hypothetical protein BMA10247_A2067 [Burkholderia mallei NCTC 10247]|nr:hypothetical protein BMA10247_A2067 [Burkholderia mallei NCTC 10247]EES21100.1 hypothetical protein BURPS1106B_1627 [Burkholderia pseudomallei 1106b]